MGRERPNDDEEGSGPDAVQQAAMDLNFPQSDVHGGTTVPANLEVADALSAAPCHVCPGTSQGTARRSKKAPDSVRPGSAGRQLGKTFYMPVRGGEVRAGAARAVVKHPQPISPSLEWVRPI